MFFTKVKTLLFISISIKNLTKHSQKNHFVHFWYLIFKIIYYNIQ